MRISLGIAVLSSALLLCGCSVMPVTNTIQTNSVPGAPFSGRVHGGQQPIVGGHVYLYAINNTGYGSAAVSLLNSGGTNTHIDGSGNYYVTTDSNGAFTITGDYTCPSATPATYVYAVGGSAGSGANSAAGLIAGVGDCTHSGYTSKYVVVNEVSTVSVAYAVAGYTVDPTHVSTSGTALSATGLNNVGNALDNLYTLNTGLALATTPAGNGTVPQSEINTLANILAACVNSNGAVTGGANPTPCYTLFTNALSGGTTGTQPTDTAMAAINIAHNPWANIVNLYSLQSGTSPFQPMLSAAPNDFTIAINYTGGGLNSPQGIAIDGSGDVWTANTGNSTLSEFSPGGATISGSGYTGGGLAFPWKIAIDSSGNVWATSYPSISETGSNGTAVSGASGYSGGGISHPVAVAIDTSNNAWITNFNAGILSEFSSSGTAKSGSGGYSGGGLAQGGGFAAIDTAGHVWVVNTNGNDISEFNSSGVAMSGASGYTGGGLSSPGPIAVDASGNIWTVNSANSISEFNSSGTAMSGTSGYTGGGLGAPFGIAIDGSGRVWAANNQAHSISEFSSGGIPISGSMGYQGGALALPYDLAIDGSGNVWVINYGGGSGSLTEFVGAATPVVTPIVANLLAPYGSHAVNKP